MHLQSQVNPHFFFNTLNNLYALVDKDSKRAKELILKLSDMMRYSIYDGQKDTVPLENELSFMQTYISLHTDRYHKTTEIQFQTKIEQEGLHIRPLLFINLLENAFKHGVEKLRKGAFVHIHLHADKECIKFEIANNFEVEYSDNQGIGIKNLKRRLVLGYPKKHSLIHSIDEDIFTVELTLETL